MKAFLASVALSVLMTVGANADYVTPYASAPNFIVIGTDLDRSSVVWSDGCGDAKTCKMTVGQKPAYRGNSEKEYRCKMTSKRTQKDGLAITSVCGWEK